MELQSPEHQKIENQWFIHFEQNGETHSYQTPWLIDATGRNASVSKLCGIHKSRDDQLICAHAFLTPFSYQHGAHTGDRTTPSGR